MTLATKQGWIVSITAIMLGGLLALCEAGCSGGECGHGEPCSDPKSVCMLIEDLDTCSQVYSCMALGSCADKRDVCSCLADEAGVDTCFYDPASGQAWATVPSDEDGCDGG